MWHCNPQDFLNFIFITEPLYFELQGLALFNHCVEQAENVGPVEPANSPGSGSHKNPQLIYIVFSNKETTYCYNTNTWSFSTDLANKENIEMFSNGNWGWKGNLEFYKWKQMSYYAFEFSFIQLNFINSRFPLRPFFCSCCFCCSSFHVKIILKYKWFCCIGIIYLIMEITLWLESWNCFFW